MRRIALVSCVKRKLTVPAAARELYISPLFRGLRDYAEVSTDAWYILSAKYGLLSPDDVIDPYELTLNRMPKAEREAWARRVEHQIAGRASRCGDHDAGRRALPRGIGTLPLRAGECGCDSVGGTIHGTPAGLAKAPSTASRCPLTSNVFMNCSASWRRYLARDSALPSVPVAGEAAQTGGLLLSGAGRVEGQWPGHKPHRSRRHPRGGYGAQLAIVESAESASGRT